MFRRVLRHPQWELRIIVSKLSGFFKVVTLIVLQTIQYNICKFYKVKYNYYDLNIYF
jgi:hypothetical protein